ncbi:MAG TPA: hypothetical protein VMH88_09915 [Gemmatimonadales bacterium]|nr:hypothetical protein [Gemmatimonadales bacterium]
MATVTVTVPPALAAYGSASFWNPAQPIPSKHGDLGLDLIQTPSVVGASGILGGVRFRVPEIGAVGLSYGRMSLGNLVQTSYSPEPDGPTIPFYTQTAALNWSLGLAGGALLIGANAGYHETQLDQVTTDGWTVDFGAGYQAGDVVRLAAATHFLGSHESAQDIYAGVEVRCWHGNLWGDTPGTIRARAGLTAGGVAGTDEQVGAGLEFGRPVRLDVLGTRQQSYGNAAWRFAAGVGITIGHYRVEFARDGGANEIGAAYRVGLAVQL